MAQYPTSTGQPNLDTPMMTQYREIKLQFPDAILFFRMGDFYEMFFEDAQCAAPLMEIALTERQKGVPMAGIPFHAAESYIRKLIVHGKKIAICEQLETKPLKGEKIVRREVVRVVTPGTYLDELSQESYLASLLFLENDLHVVLCDISTGVLLRKSLPVSTEAGRDYLSHLRTLFMQYSIREVLVGGDFWQQALSERVEFFQEMKVFVNQIDDWILEENYIERIILEFFGVVSLQAVFPEGRDIHRGAAGSLAALLHYLRETQKFLLPHIRIPRNLVDEGILFLDENAIRSLDLVENQSEGGVKATLFGAMDRTRTPMGRRLLKWSILNPLRSEPEILQRQTLVGYLLERQDVARQIQEKLENIRDLEKLLGKIAASRAVPKDMGLLRDSLAESLKLSALLVQDPYWREKLPGAISLSDQDAELLRSLGQYLQELFVEEMPFQFEKPMIRSEYCEQVRYLRQLAQNSQDWLQRYQEEQRQATGINTLKVKYNRVFGFFIEMTRAQAEQVPASYMRKQTLVNAERFTTPELNDYERDVVSAEQRLLSREKELFDEAVQRVLALGAHIQQLARLVAFCDLILSFAQSAQENSYCAPKLVSEPVLRIIDGRHPVVEQFLHRGDFVSNDLILNGQDRQLALITGPNMAGKSTYIRQNALITLMAHIGSFVPAREAVIGLCDRIFTRIGSGDNLTRGQSTFLVEMQETAAILNHFTRNSLLILDEIGRGTSTYDGLAIAWSIMEYLSRRETWQPRLLFATHFHELTVLANQYGVFNLTLRIDETKKGLRFLRRVIDGAADRSYGVQVARLAGLPGAVIRRATAILNHLETNQVASQQRELFVNLKSAGESMIPGIGMPEPVVERQESLRLKQEDLLSEIEQTDVNSLTPVEALRLLDRWQRRLRG